MNIVQRGAAFIQFLQQQAQRTEAAWKQCPHCGSQQTMKSGHYFRHTWFEEGRSRVPVQRHKCHSCGKTYSEQSPLLVARSWYARSVHRCAIDHCQHMGASLRRTAEMLRSWLGRQERWLLWHPEGGARLEQCYLAASTVHRWMDGVGREAQASVTEQWSGLPSSKVVGTDGLWARLRGGATRVVLLLRDQISGFVWPPVVAKGEASAGPWRRLFERAQTAGLALDQLRGVTSDGAAGLAAYLRQGLPWVEQQRCVWHLWRNLGAELTRAASRAAEGLVDEAAKQARRAVRQELTGWIHQIIDAASFEQGEAALAALRGHPQGARIAQVLDEQSTPSWCTCWHTIAGWDG